MTTEEMRQEAAKHLQTLIAMVISLPVQPSPTEVGRLQGQAAKYLIWAGRPATCEALIVQSCEDQYGRLCGKPCVEGHALCADHLRQQREQWES